MGSPVTRATPPAADPAGVSHVRLLILRATYLLLAVGLGTTIAPVLLMHDPMARGVIPSLLGGVWLLSFVGLRHPLPMLPLLVFEFAWKTIWLVAFGLPQWFSDRQPQTFAEDFMPILAGVILMPLVIPWGYVYRRYGPTANRSG